MKKRVGCLLLGISILCLPAQEVLAAPLEPVAPIEEKIEEEKKTHERKPHEEKKLHEKKPHEEKPVPPAEREKPVPPAEREKPVPPAAGEKPVPPASGEKPVPPHEKEETKPEVPVVRPPEVAPNVEETVKEEQQNNSVIEEQKKEETEEVEEVVEKETLSLQQQVVEYALQFVGNPYKYGGTSLTNGADCSGFVQSVYAHFNYSLPRVSREQASGAGYMEVSAQKSELVPGDLVFYANNSGMVYHVALYIGDGKVVHAANSNQGIIVSEYAYIKPYKARRIIK